MDVSKTLQSLHNPDASIVRKALQRVHVRWWHATTEQLLRILKASGAPARALGMVSSVVQACQVCRQWVRPANKIVLSSSITERFDDDVQFDLFFYESLVEPKRGRRPIIHMIDTCIRWSATLDISSKDEKTLLNGIATI